MTGAGVMMDAIKTLRRNRTLLKGDNSSTYKSFDKSYITNSIISREAPIYNKASKEYLKQIRLEQIQIKKSTRRKSASILFLAI